MFLRISMLIAVLSGSSLFGQAPMPRKNYVADGNFGAGLKQWHFFKSRAGEVIGKGGPKGQNCFKISGEQNNHIYLYNKGARSGWGVNLEEGKTYTLSAWMKTENLDLSKFHQGKALHVINYGWTNSAGLGPDGPNSPWKHYSITFKAPAQTRSFDHTANGYSLLLFWPHGASGSLYVTDIQIEEGAKSSEFTNFWNLQYTLALEKIQNLTARIKRAQAEAASAKSYAARFQALMNKLNTVSRFLAGNPNNNAYEKAFGEFENIEKELAQLITPVWLKNPLLFPHTTDLPAEQNSPRLLELTMFANQTRSVGVMLTNLSGKPVDFRVGVQPLYEQNSSHRVSAGDLAKIYNTPLLRGHAQRDELFSDLLTEAGPFGLVTVPSGTTRQVVVTFDSTFLHPGIYNGSIVITNLSDYGDSAELPVKLNVCDVALPDRIGLDVGAFGLDTLRREEVEKLALNMVQLDYGSFAGLLDRSGILAPTDFTSLAGKIRQVRSVSPRARFMVNFSAGIAFVRQAESHGLRWPDQRIKDGWQAWLRSFYQVLEANGVSPADLYLQVVDEPNEGDMILAIELQKLAKEAVPQARLTTTLTTVNLNNERQKEFLRSVDYIIPLVNTARNPEIIEYFRQQGARLGIYDCAEAGESLQPVSYYRLMPLRAWKDRLDGIFFWYRDDRFPNFERVKYMSVIYPRRDGSRIVTAAPVREDEGYEISRRYLGLAAGIQDYKILTRVKSIIDSGNASPVFDQLNDLLARYPDVVLALDDAAGYPRTLAAGADPDLPDKANETTAALCMESLKNDDLRAITRPSIHGNQLQLAFNRPVKIRIEYRVDGGETLYRQAIGDMSDHFAVTLREGEINYCQIKATAENGKVIVVSPFVKRSVKVSGTFPGYDYQCLVDGIRVPGSLYVPGQSWLSTAENKEHVVEISWPAETVSKVNLYWMSRGGLPQRYKLQLHCGGNWTDLLPEGTRAAAGAVETIAFEPVSADGLKVILEPGGGNLQLPSMFGLNEIEIY